MREFLNKEVEVYFNLNKKVWSIRAKVDGKRKVVGYVERLTLLPTAFKVGEKSRQRVIREGQKNVHAYIKGILIDFDQFKECSDLTVSYNPYNKGYFFDVETGEEYNDTSTPLFFDHLTKKCHGIKA